MKIVCTLIAMLSCLSFGYSADFMTEIDQRAEQILDTSSISEEDEELLEFYSAEVAKCDIDMLALPLFGSHWLTEKTDREYSDKHWWGAQTEMEAPRCIISRASVVVTGA